MIPFLFGTARSVMEMGTEIVTRKKAMLSRSQGASGSGKHKSYECSCVSLIAFEAVVFRPERQDMCN